MEGIQLLARAEKKGSPHLIGIHGSRSIIGFAPCLPQAFVIYWHVMNYSRTFLLFLQNFDVSKHTWR